MLKYQAKIKEYYREILIPSYSVYEWMILVVSIAFLIMGAILQGNQYSFLSVVALLPGFYGLNHIVTNDSKRKIRKIFTEYIRYCRVSGIHRNLMIDTSDESLHQAKKIWFCMNHQARPEELYCLARKIKSEWQDYKEIKTSEPITFSKAIKLAFGFDYNRIISLLSIVAALISVVFIMGSSNPEPIFEAFISEVMPVLIGPILYIALAYIMLIFISGFASGFVSFYDLMSMKFNSQPTERATRRYIHDMMWVSD